MCRFEVRPNNNLFYQPSVVIEIPDNGCVYIVAKECAEDRRSTQKRFGVYNNSSQELQANKKAAWVWIKNFMKKQGHTDLLCNKLRD